MTSLEKKLMAMYNKDYYKKNKEKIKMKNKENYIKRREKIISEKKNSIILMFPEYKDDINMFSGKKITYLYNIHILGKSYKRSEK